METQVQIYKKKLIKRMQRHVCTVSQVLYLSRLTDIYLRPICELSNYSQRISAYPFENIVCVPITLYLIFTVF